MDRRRARDVGRGDERRNAPGLAGVLAALAAAPSAADAVRFGSRLQHEVAVGAQRFSNAGLRRPNDGINDAEVTAAGYWQ